MPAADGGWDTMDDLVTPCRHVILVRVGSPQLCRRTALADGATKSIRGLQRCTGLG